MPHIPILVEKITELNALQGDYIANVLADMPVTEREGLEAYIRYCLNRGSDYDYLASAYDQIVKDMLREQIFFRKHKRYRYATFADVAGSVYLNAEYMGKYMHGLAITAFLWPNHVKMKEYLLETIPKAMPGSYLEVGPGHGFNMMLAMRHSAFSSFEGIDVSPTSVALTRDMLSSPEFGGFSGFNIHESDFFAAPVDSLYDAFVMGEVLEHVEDPVSFIVKIREITHKDSYIFLTTCINSPASDHIYLFDTVESVADVIRAGGLHVKEQLVLPYHGTTLERSIDERLPINIALVLGHGAG